MDISKLARPLTHPFFIGLVITAIIAILVLPDIQKYRVDVIEKNSLGAGNSVIFSDLDNDKVFEKIVFHDTPKVFNIMLYRGQVLIDQHNLSSKPLYADYINIQDYDNDGLKELYFFTYRNDSILLSILDPFDKKGFIVKERLVFYSDTISFENDVPTSYFLGLVDFGFKPEKDPVFALQAGFIQQPRSFYRYDISKDRLKVSPLSGVSFRDSRIVDMNADSIPEILFTTRATGNNEPDFPYSDQGCWLMVLDQNLDFVFDPIEFPGYPSSLAVSPYQYKGSDYLVALHQIHGNDPVQSRLYLFDHTGKELRSKPVDQIYLDGYYLYTIRQKGHPYIAVLDVTNCRVSLLNENLEETSTYAIPELRRGGSIEEMDLDFDGKQEIVAHEKNSGAFVVFRKGFRHPVVVDLGEGGYPLYLSSYLENDICYTYAQFRGTGYLLQYRQDPFYYLKYPLLVISYIAISLLIYLIYRLQRYRAEKMYLTKKKISELQILNLKNQIDPHFTFNVLNSIGSLYTRGADKKQAYNLFVKYSNLLRSTIQNSDNISIPIKDELDFVSDYVELEQFRSNHGFDYKISIEDGVDLNKNIPRMLIHSFVENAIKHGVRMAEKDPVLELKITRDKNSHQILIRDNGPGLNSKTGQRAPGTGKGMQIIDEMLSLFYQLEGIRITYTLEDLSSQDPSQKGTIAVIAIPG